MNLKMLAVLGLGAIMVGCAATQVNPRAKRVRIVKSEPANCEFMGDVVGSQGNFFTGGYTSNKNLEIGARNDLKNQAANMGANTIVLITNRAGQTGSFGRFGGRSQQTNVTLSGSAYKCTKRISKKKRRKLRRTTKRSRRAKRKS